MNIEPGCDYSPFDPLPTGGWFDLWLARLMGNGQIADAADVNEASDRYGRKAQVFLDDNGSAWVSIVVNTADGGELQGPIVPLRLVTDQEAHDAAELLGIMEASQ